MSFITVIFYFALAVISVVYVSAGFMKVLGQEPMKSRMDEMNHGGYVRVVIGLLEILGVIAIWLPDTRPLALVCLLPFSVGGLAVHIALKHNFRERNIPAVLMIVFIVVALWLDPTFSIIFK
jgi:putative oxidoreductase